MTDYKERLKDLQTERRLLCRDKEKTELSLANLKTELEDHEKAKWVLSKVVEETQKNFKERVESLTTLMLQSIFDEQFRFELIFEEKNKQLECRPVVFEGENEYKPDDDLGGSIIDIISFALRLVLWSIEEPQSRNTFFLDEPFRWVGRGGELQKAMKLLRELSYKLNIQLIIITHEERLIEIADYAYQVSKKNRVSTVTKVKG